MADTVNNKELEDLLGKTSAWLPKAMEQLGCSAPIDVTSVVCNKAMKSTLVQLLTDSYHMVRFQNEKLKQLKAELSSTKSQLIENQKWVISLQENLIDVKTEQLQSVQDTVRKSVVETVPTIVKTSISDQFKSYSAAVQENVVVCQSEGIAPKTLRTVVKSVVREEDRTRNVIMFGLEETENEDIVACVKDVFMDMDMKPNVQVSRIGKAGSKRPVKVAFSSPSTALQALRQAKQLKDSSKFSKVFIRPDRSVEERIQNKKLVEELHKRRVEQPKKRHFIHGGTVRTLDSKTDNSAV